MRNQTAFLRHQRTCSSSCDEAVHHCRQLKVRKHKFCRGFCAVIVVKSSQSVTTPSKEERKFEELPAFDILKIFMIFL